MPRLKQHTPRQRRERGLTLEEQEAEMMRSKAYLLEKAGVIPKRKRRRAKFPSFQGTRNKAFQEIRHFQQSTDTLLLKAPFQRLVRQICHQIEHENFQYELSNYHRKLKTQMLEEEDVQNGKTILKRISGFEAQFRWTSSAIEALQVSTEAFITELFADANLCTLHAKRVTVFPKDMQLALRLRGDANRGSNSWKPVL